MKKKKVRKVAIKPKRKRVVWFEEYSCGCISNIKRVKSELLGYCATHGNCVRNTFKDYVLYERDADS